MNLDELRSVQNRERQSSELQDLRPSFYADAAQFVRELREDRARVVREEGLDSRAFERLSNDIEAAERAVESVYERRVGKVVKLASIAAADMPTADDGLTTEERELFETLVENIRSNRERILTRLDPDEESTGSPDEPPTEDATGGVETPPGGEPGVDVDVSPHGSDEGRIAGTSDDASTESRPTESGVGNRPTGRSQSTDTSDPTEPVDGRGSVRSGEDEVDPGEDEVDPGEDEVDPGEDEVDPGEDEVDRATVRITADVGEILGVDQRAYHLSREDVVTLPETNAAPLVEQGAAERID